MILFTSKQDAPPIFRALAGNLPHSFEFAYVVDSDKAIVEQFNVKRVPAMMIALIDPESEGVRLQPYPGSESCQPESTACCCSLLSTTITSQSSPIQVLSALLGKTLVSRKDACSSQASSSTLRCISS